MTPMAAAMQYTLHTALQYVLANMEIKNYAAKLQSMKYNASLFNKKVENLNIKIST